MVDAEYKKTFEDPEPTRKEIQSMYMELTKLNARFRRQVHKAFA